MHRIRLLAATAILVAFMTSFSPSLDPTTHASQNELVSATVGQQLFLDDFSSGSLSRWSFPIGGAAFWSAWNGLMRANIPQCAVGTLATAGEPWWKDYALDYDVTDFGVDDFADVRIGPTGSRYRVELLRRPNWVPARVRLWGLPQGPIDYTFDHLFSGVTNHVRIEVVGTTLKTYVDNILVFQRTDSQPPSFSGSIGLGVNSGAWCTADARFDNVVVTSLSDKNISFILNPQTVSLPIGQMHTVTAVLTRDGSPLSGVPVSFSVTGANTASASIATDATGKAIFQYRGYNVGNDSVMASAAIGGQNIVANTVNSIWEANSSVGILLNVPLLKQTDARWSGDPYGTVGYPDTIYQWGCYLTSWAMILNYYGSQVYPVFQTDPRILDNWLKGTPNGFSPPPRYVNQYAVADYARLVGNIGVFPPQVWPRDDQLLHQLLAAKKPVILGVNADQGIPRHFVLAIGETILPSGKTTWYINDPYGNYGTLEEGYQNQYINIQWADVVLPGELAQYASIMATLASPAELLVTDPQGRRTGVDPRTGNTYNEIPGSAYFSEALVDDTGTGGTEHPVKIFSSWAPLNGSYTILVTGTGSGTYDLEVVNHDANGIPTSAAVSRQAQAGSLDGYRMDYPSDSVTPASLVLDIVSPTTTSTVFPSPSSSGWNYTPVTVTVTALDNPGGSGTQSISYSASGAQPIASTTILSSTAVFSITAEGQTSISYFATDNAGNAERTKAITVSIDKTPPTITVSQPSNGDIYTINQVITASYICSDTYSGVANCAGTVPLGNNIDTSSAGIKTFTVNTIDKATNAASQTVTYTVAYSIQLLYDPTKAAKSGSTIPIKLQLTDATGNNMSSSGIIITALGVTLVSNNALGTVEDSGNANPDNNFRYDSTLVGTGGYIYNLSTKGLGTGTYTLSFKTGDDPIVHTVQFQVK